MEEIELLFLELEEKMQKAIDHYKNQLSRISTGRANPQILNSIRIEYFGSMVPIYEVASISINEGIQLVIKPYDVKINKSITDSINNSSLGIQAVDEGDRVRITFPEMTTEKRKMLVKKMSTDTEKACVEIRMARQYGNKFIKNLDISEDDERRELDSIQKLTNKYISKINDIEKDKANELLTI